MQLWIRSQDKNRLTKVDDLYIVHDDNNFCDYIGNNMVGHLAKYTKQGRALEVLNEIQKLITPQIIMREMKSTGLIENGMSDGTLYIKNEPIVQIIDPIVYEMPKE